MNINQATKDFLFRLFLFFIVQIAFDLAYTFYVKNYVGLNEEASNQEYLVCSAYLLLSSGIIAFFCLVLKPINESSELINPLIVVLFLVLAKNIFLNSCYSCTVVILMGAMAKLVISIGGVYLGIFLYVLYKRFLGK